MGDPLHNLEQRLERLVPQGLSDGGRERLEAQIDELAAELGTAEKGGGHWRRFAAVAAAVVAVAGVAIFGTPGEQDGNTVVAPAVKPAPVVVEPEAAFETMEYEREVVDHNDDGVIVVGRFHEPVHSRTMIVREMELVIDKETGLRVRIVSERKEVVLTAVTSF